jgi:predicted membrane protein
MDNDIKFENNKPRNNKALAGIILLVVGLVLLVHQLDLFFFPGWLISWPMGLIAIGVYNGAKHQFRNSGWLIMVLIGVIWLSNEMFPHYDASRVTWPLCIIIFGLWMILRRGNKWDKHKADWDRWQQNQQTPPPSTDPNDPDTPNAANNWGYKGEYKNTYGDDYLDAVSVFGGVKKTILAKDFKGGEIVNIFGGAELDLTQADINGRVVLDITQIFGGTKIVVPSNWQVVSDIAAVFASVDDKRIRSTAALGSEKILVLKGVSIFAGIDIRSY